MYLNIGFSDTANSAINSIRSSEIGNEPEEEYESFMAPKNYQEYIYRIYVDDYKDGKLVYAKSLWDAEII